MLDIPETLSILLAIVLLVLATRNWLSNYGVNKADRSKDPDD